MAFWRRISDNVFGESGPAQIEVTPRGDSVLLRLPTQRYSRDRTVPWLLVALVLGGIVITGAIRRPTNLGGSLIVVGAALTAMACAICAWRVCWHYEILLGGNHLRVERFSTFRNRCTVQLELEPIRQLTLVCSGMDCKLLAESVTDPPVEILANRDVSQMRALARLIVQHHATLAPTRPEIRVGEEVNPHVSADTDRVEPPLNSCIEVGTSHAGLTFDFPLPEDERPGTRKAAWRWFEIAILLLMGAVIWYAICGMTNFDEGRDYAKYPFIAGLIMLVTAATQGMATWTDPRQDNDLRQLSVLEKMLVRTSRDHRKQIWYGAEIRTIQAVVIVSTSSSEGGGSSVSYMLRLVVELRSGQKIDLVQRDYDPADYRPKAEYEWIATKLRHALMDEQPADSVPPSTAIVELDRAASESHVTPTGPASPRRD